MLHHFNCTIIICFLSISSSFAETQSCTQQLKAVEWPTDCLLGLKIAKTPKSHTNYRNLNLWCDLNSEKLSKKSVPKIFLSLSPPRTCLKQAEGQLKQQKVLQILRGDFLNSFL